MRWTSDRQRLFADLSALGMSAGDIAYVTGESVNAVKCAMWRYGLFARVKRTIAPRDGPVPQPRG